MFNYFKELFVKWGESVYFFFYKNFSINSLYFIIFFGFYFISLEHKISQLQPIINDINLQNKFITVNNFIRNCSNWQNPAKNIKILNINDSYIYNAYGLKQIDLNLIYNIIQENLQTQSNTPKITYFIQPEDSKIWSNFKKENSNLVFKSLKIESTIIENEPKINEYNYLKKWRSLGSLILIGLIITDFSLNNIIT